MKKKLFFRLVEDLWTFLNQEFGKDPNYSKGVVPAEKILSKCEDLIVSSFAMVYLNISVMKVNYTALVICY